jgi:hypothetical protein
VRQVGYLQDLYQDAWSAKHKKHKKVLYVAIYDTLKAVVLAGLKNPIICHLEFH